MHPGNLIITGLVALPLAACDDPDSHNVVVGELASDRIELVAEVNEPILEVFVAEGQTVTAGQLILRQDDTRASARLREAEAAVAQAQARLDELVRGPREEQIAQARANLAGADRDIEFRRTQYQRVKDLLEKGLASPETRDRARAELDAATERAYANLPYHYRWLNDWEYVHRADLPVVAGKHGFLFSVLPA